VDTAVEFESPTTFVNTSCVFAFFVPRIASDYDQNVPIRSSDPCIGYRGQRRRSVPADPCIPAETVVATLAKKFTRPAKQMGHIERDEERSCSAQAMRTSVSRSR